VRISDFRARSRRDRIRCPEVRGAVSSGEIDDDLPRLRSDPVKLKVVLKNLFGNAVKFTERGIRRSSAPVPDDGSRDRVADSGHRHRPRRLPVIFEPFRQADGSRLAPHGGVGLGLYIVRRLLDMLGGTVEVESEVGPRPGDGEEAARGH
jgi:signal transduction histidine kinase